MLDKSITHAWTILTEHLTCWCYSCIDLDWFSRSNKTLTAFCSRRLSYKVLVYSVAGTQNTEMPVETRSLVILSTKSQ